MTGTAQDWGARVRRQRELLGLSQGIAARRAGLSPSGWRKIEQAANVGTPSRTSVVQIARVLNWDPDEQLRSLGLDPLTDAERQAPPRDPQSELDRLWASLSDPQRWALVNVAATMVVPRQWPEFGNLAGDEEIQGTWTMEIRGDHPAVPHADDPQRTEAEENS